ncbi:hypothetical protein AB3S75_023463 [Citrus x aurantiifolia]
MLQNLPRLPASLRLISLDGCVSLETLSDVLNLNEHQLPYLQLRCVDCLKLAGNYDLAPSLLKEYIKNSEGRGRDFHIVVPGSEIPEWFEEQFGQAMSDHLFLCYKNGEDISKVTFDSLSGLELKRCGLHPIYVHKGDKFNQTIGPVWRLNEFGHDCSGSTTSSERSFLKRSLEEYVGAAEASGSGCCNDEEEPQPKRFRQLE